MIFIKAPLNVSDNCQLSLQDVYKKGGKFKKFTNFFINNGTKLKLQFSSEIRFYDGKKTAENFVFV